MGKILSDSTEVTHLEKIVPINHASMFCKGTVGPHTWVCNSVSRMKKIVKGIDKEVRGHILILSP